MTKDIFKLALVNIFGLRKCKKVLPALSLKHDHMKWQFTFDRTCINLHKYEQTVFYIFQSSVNERDC